MSRIIFSFVLLLTCVTGAYACPGPPCQRAILDFDGDNKTDYVIMRIACGDTKWSWNMQKSTEGFESFFYGVADTQSVTTDRLIPGDYDGDGKWDFAVWRSGGGLAYFFIYQSTTHTTRVLQWGINGDHPVVTQDFDGDGKADPAVTRVVGTQLTWYIYQSHDGIKVVSFGASTDFGIRGDYDGDSKADLAVYRSIGTSAGTFFVQRSSDLGVQTLTFGNLGTDSLLPADFDGDGKTDYAVFRQDSGSAGNDTWYWVQSSDGGFRSLPFGTDSDFPALGDYDGDGKADPAVWRRGFTGTFYVNRSSLGFVSFPFGTAGDRPLAHHFLFPY